VPRQGFLRKARRRLLAQFRDARLLVREFSASLATLLVLMLGGGWLLQATYTLKPLTHAQATYAVFAMVFFQNSLDFPPQWWLQVFFFAVPLLGIVLIVEGVARFGGLVVNKARRGEEWQKVLASTYRDHVILCGLGHVGFRVAEQLLSLDEEFVVITRESKFLDVLRQKDVPVILGDCRSADLLQAASLASARAVVVATSDDLTNLETALTAKKLNKDVRLVARMFDADLAAKMQEALGIHLAFSTSALAAPDIALAALDKNVLHSFYVGESLLNLAELQFSPESRFVGKVLEEFEKELEVTVVVHRRGTQVELHPVATQELRVGDSVVLLATLEKLGQLSRAGLTFVRRVAPPKG